MTFHQKMSRHRHKVLPVLFTLGIAAATIIFWAPLRGWFTMEASGGQRSESEGVEAGPFRFEAELQPEAARQKGNTLHLRISDSEGKPVEGATVEVEYSMPAMGSMPEMRGGADVTEAGDGGYRARFDLPMGGSWTLEVDVTAAEASGSAQYSFTIGTPGLIAKGGTGNADGAKQADARPQPPTLPELELPAAAVSELERGFAAYERARELLASDSVAGLDQAALQVAESLRLAAEKVEQPELQAALADGRAAAEGLARAADAAQARPHFSELSRILVGLSVADPRLQEDLHVFSCPMADGFNKWVQPSKKLENPYMGQEMLTCGSSSTFEPPVGNDEPIVSHDGHGHEGSDVAHYTCAMHPSVKQKEPGTCPICAMDLSPVNYDEKEGGVLLIDEERRQRIGVTLGKVERRPMKLQIRAVGRATYDERKLTEVTTRIRGYVQELKVDETGQEVKKGQVLMTLYSPELYAAQQEYLLAIESQGRAEERGSSRSSYLVDAARRKLELWEMTSGQIERLARRGKPSDHVPILAPASGFVIEKNVVDGAAINPGDRLYRIAPIEKVWIEAEVYEADLPRIAVGQTAQVTLPYMPGRRYEAAITHVYPYLDHKTRTGRIRVEVDNEDLALKPNMYANVTIEVDLGERLTVPVSAVVYTGPRRLVFVDLGESRIRPAEVELGVKAGDHYEVLSGVSAGQRIITSGNFLIASESRLRSSLDYWEAGDETE